MAPWYRPTEEPPVSLRPALLCVTVAAALAACGGKAPESAPGTAAPQAAPPADKGAVHVYNWSDYVAEDTIENFEKETGISVVYDVYADNETLDAKLSAGQSGYDVVFPSARPFAERHIATGIYQPIDKNKLSNYGNLDPAILTSLEDADPGNAHLVPYMWGTTGIGYNVAKVRERLGADAALDSWSLLFDSATTAKLKDCGIAFLDDQQEGFYAALIFLGRDPRQSGGDEIEAVQRLFAAVRENVRYFNSSKYIDDLANGEICIAMGYNGDVLQARDRAAEAENGVDIAYIIPKEGAVRWVDGMAIPKDAPHADNAHTFINFVLKPETIAQVTNYVSYANANLASKPLVDESIRTDAGTYPPDDIFARLVDARTLPDEANRARERAWTSIKSGR
jgi:putrescine transport system substrate-binding protein